MTVFHLFRLKIERSAEPSLFADPSLSNRDIILAAIEQKPSNALRNGQEWRIGNIQRPTSSSVFFALGKITKSTRQSYDEEQGNFVELAFDEAPHTYVVVDLELQVCAIARKANVSRKPKGAATNLQRLLNAAQLSQPENERLTFVLSSIEDPEEFLDSVRSAYRVSEFTISFSLPNPLDVNRQIVEPMERYLQAAGGENGETTIRGEQLDTDLLEDLTRSAATTGNRTRARIQTSPEDQQISKRSDGNQASVSVDEVVTEEEKRKLLELIRDVYRKIREPRS